MLFYNAYYSYACLNFDSHFICDDQKYIFACFLDLCEFLEVIFVEIEKEEWIKLKLFVSFYFYCLVFVYFLHLYCFITPFTIVPNLHKFPPSSFFSPQHRHQQLEIDMIQFI